MRTETIELGGAPGVRHALLVRRFGASGARPKVHVQAGLHADELPGVLAAHHLTAALERLDAAGEVAGEIVVLPLANPPGLAQRVLGSGLGRFDLADGANYNRGYPALWRPAGDALEGRLGPDGAANAALARAALRGAAANLPALTPAEHLKRALLRLACDADVVLDLHCDGQGVMHLYALTPQAEAAAPLARIIGAEAFLLAEVSGDEPFDEACSRSFPELRRRFPDAALPGDCVAVTVELRGEGDVSRAFAEADAAALVAYLRHLGALTGPAPELPLARSAPTPLAGVMPLVAPADGVIALRASLGARVEEGEIVADLVDPASGRETPVAAGTTGLLFALHAARYVPAGRRFGKVAGAEPLRGGKLLSP